MSLTITGATGNHAIRQASLKEVYTSTTNLWMSGIYNRSLRNVIRIFLRIHLAPARMVRYQDARRRKAEKKQAKKEQQGLDRRFKKHQTSRLMNKLEMAVINNRPTFVVQKIMEKLQHSLDTLIKNLDMEIQSEGELDEWDMTIYTASEEDDVEDTEEEEMVTDSEVIQETPAKTIRALVSIVRMLTESAKIQHVVTSDDIQKAAFRGTTFTDKEKAVSAKIVNFLRPFVPKRTIDNQLPDPHVLTRAPLAALANCIATIAGFPALVHKLSITSQKGVRALHLTAAGIYDTFHEQYDIPIDDTNWITNSYQAGKSKVATFSAIFNTKQIHKHLDSYGLQFAWRLVYVNKWTIRLLGRAKPGKTILKSNYEERRKGKTHVTKSVLTTEMPTSDRLKMEALADTYASQVKDLACKLRPLHKEISQLELSRMEIGRRVRNQPWDPGSEIYQQLRGVRQKILAKRLEAIEIEKMIASARSSLYRLNVALRATNTASTTSTTNTTSTTSTTRTTRTTNTTGTTGNTSTASTTDTTRITGTTSTTGTISTTATFLNTSPLDKAVKEDYIENVRLEQFCCLFSHVAPFNYLSVSKIDEFTSSNQRASLFT